MLIHIVFSITLTYWSVFLTTIQNQKLPFHKLQSPELSPPSARPSGNLHRHLNKTFKSCNFFQVESSILQMALYNPPIHLFAVLWKVLFFGWRQNPSIQTESLTATSSTSPSRPLTAARQTQQHTRLIKHVLFFFFFPAGFYLHDHVWRSVHFDQFFGFSHMASLGQPDLIKDSQTVYMHQITPHALCSAASGVALQSPPPFPSALCSLPPSFPPLLPKTSWLQTPLFSLPPNPLFAISHWKRCSLLPAPTFFILASHFHFTQSCFQWPHPSNFPPIFPCSCSSRWKVCVLILLHHKKAPSTERDHPLSPICNSVFCLPLTLLASLSDPKSLSHLLSVSPSVSPYTPIVLLSNNCVFICLSSSAANWFNLLILEHNVSQQQTPTDFRILFSFITALLPQLLPCLK